MAGKIVGWAFQQPCSPTAKLVLVKLADSSNKSGYCWPSISRIVEHTGLAERTVRKNLRLLEQTGLVLIERRKRGNRPTSNGYQLALEPVDNYVSTSEAAPLLMQTLPAGDAPPTGMACPSIRTVIEPPLNLAQQISQVGDARALEARIATLRDKLGKAVFDAWFGGAEFHDGPPVRIIVPRQFQANWIRGHFSGAIERLLGSAVQILAADEGPRPQLGRTDGDRGPLAEG